MEYPVANLESKVKRVVQKSDWQPRGSDIDFDQTLPHIGSGSGTARERDEVARAQIQEAVNYGIDLEISVYEGQIKLGYRLPLHPFAFAFFNYYQKAPGQLVPNGWRKLVALIYLLQTTGYTVGVQDFMRLYIEICYLKNVAQKYLGGITTSITSLGCLREGLNPIKSSTPEMSGKSEGRKGSFVGLLQKASKGKRKETLGEDLPPVIKNPQTPILTAPPLMTESVTIDEDLIFHPRWTIRRDDFGMPSLHISAQNLAHGLLPSDKLIMENQTHNAFSMAHVQAAYNMHERFEMAREMAREVEREKKEGLAKINDL
ncbi:hypothetical protein RJ639_013481 [Escallonia herrerae]|uniref:Transposase (putative) gypsy type domain-containing protein n=1 Tax=Escallonia herrerae TaxID=1293975 RepID=A0AA89AP10_9ASTE|nr:hypothetical protein RJ639_013481 [Escallonia herrerae]